MISHQNIKSINENYNLHAINNNIQMSAGIANNKNINLINGINLSNQIEENFFKNAGSNQRDSSNSNNNNQNKNIDNSENFHANSFKSINNENKTGANNNLERKVSIGKNYFKG